MEWTLVYGFLAGLALFVVVWFVFVVPSERRDHERRLALVRKRLAEREEQLARIREEEDKAGAGESERNNDQGERTTDDTSR